MNKAPDLNHRLSRPTTLGGAFGGLMRMFGGQTSDADLAAKWAEIVGSDVAEMADLVGISKGVSRQPSAVKNETSNTTNGSRSGFRRNDNLMADDIVGRLYGLFDSLPNGFDGAIQFFGLDMAGIESAWRLAQKSRPDICPRILFFVGMDFKNVMREA